LKLADEGLSVPAVPSFIIEPVWEQFAALLPVRAVQHPKGGHRPRIPDRVVFDKLIQVLVFGCATGGSPTGRARPRRCAAGATSGSHLA
jgi:hypothetical protein